MFRFPLLGCVALFAAASFGVASPSRPNIVFIFSDDHALKAISAYGNALNQTPHIDKIAEQGMIFTRSYCTNSICGPSRATVLTGMHSHRNGYLRNSGQPPFDTVQTALPELMRSAGYQTALLGKWHLESRPVGFDYFEILPGQGSYYNPDFIRMKGPNIRREGYCTDVVTDLALEWLEKDRDKSKPFMVMIQHKAPHRTFAPPLHHLATYQEGSFPEPETLFDDYSGRPEILKKNEMEIARHFMWDYDLKVRNFNPDGSPGGRCNEYPRMTPAQREAWDAHFDPLNEKLKADVASGKLKDKDLVRWKYQRYLANYMGTIASVDENVGRVLDYLDKNNLSQNTIVIYSADQGFYLGEHGWYDKRWMYEESFAMPFLIRWPGVVKPGTKSEKLIQNLDYAPTFLEIAGVEAPSRMQGRSLIPLLKGERTEWRDSLYYAYYEQQREHNVPIHDGVATERYKLIHFPDTNEWSLIDLVKDPLELRSYHNDPSYTGVMNEMKKRYESLRASYQVSESSVPTSGSGEWQAHHNKVRDMALKEGGKSDFVILGDESLDAWKERLPKSEVIDMSHPGEFTERVLWRIKTRAWPATLQPKTVVLGIGAANAKAGRPAAETAQAIGLIVDDVRDRAPGAEILLLALPERDAPSHAEINRHIAKLGEQENVRLVKRPDDFPKLSD